MKVNCPYVITTLSLFFCFFCNCTSTSHKEPKVSCEKQDIEIYENKKDSLGFIPAYCRKSDKWGFVDKDTNVIIPLIYDFLNSFDEAGMAIAKKGDSKGFLNRESQEAIPFIYSNLGVFSEELAYARLNEGYGYINRQNKTIIPFKYSSADNFRGKLARIKLTGKYGCINTEGKEIIPPIYSDIDLNELELLVAVENKRKWAFFSYTGQNLTGFIFDEIYTTYSKEKGFGTFVNGLALARKGNDYAYLNKNLEYVIPFGKFSEASPFNTYHWAIVKQNGKYGMIDTLGNFKIPLIYDDIISGISTSVGSDSDTPHFLQVKKNQKWGLLDFDGKELTPIIYEEITESETNGNSIFYLIKTKTDENSFTPLINGNTQVVDERGNIIIRSKQYDKIRPFGGNKVTFVMKNGKYGLIDGKNNQITGFIFDSINPNHGFIVKKNDKYGLIDETGKDVLPFNYDALEYCLYSEKGNEKFIAQKNNKKGIINSKNEVVVPFEYDKLSNWEFEVHEQHIVCKDGKYGIIDTTGEIKVPTIYDHLDFCDIRFIKVSKNGKWGMINIKNAIRIPLQYDDIFIDYGAFYKETIIYVKTGNKYYEISQTGKIIKEVPKSVIQKMRDDIEN